MPSRVTLRDKVIYDVLYTVNSQGYRITPDHPNAREAIFFFGCSYTMGTGVNDVETSPYRVADNLGSAWQVRNFGCGGQGTHHFDQPLYGGWLGRQWTHLAQAFKHTEICRQTIMQVLQCTHTAMLERQGAILLAAQDYIAPKYPKARFTLLLYPTVDAGTSLYARGHTHPASVALFPQMAGGYPVPHFRRPDSSLAQDCIPRAVTAYILERAPADTASRP